MFGRYVISALAGVAVLSGATAQARVTSDDAPLAQIAEAAVFQLCVPLASGAKPTPASFTADPNQDVYDLQPEGYPQGRFAKIKTAQGDLRIAVFPEKHDCRIGVGDAPVEAVKAQLVAAVTAPTSLWRIRSSNEKNGAWRLAYELKSDASGPPLVISLNGFDQLQSGGRGRQMWITVGEDSSGRPD